MTKLQTEKPKTLPEFISLIEKARKKSGNPLWYRGCGLSSEQLTPSLFRHKKIKKIDALVGTEYQLMTRFRQRSIPFHDKSLEDDWESLFLMQHYGIPTRLLDWTENPLIALFFAVMSAKRKYIKGIMKYQHPAVVWILDPIVWNRHALESVSFDQDVLSTNDDQIKGYKPTSNFTGMKDKPVALYGAHNSPRIVAQRGVFVLFGQNTSSMEKQFIHNNFPENCLKKVILNRSVLLNLRNSILENGITESVVFPDLEGLAKEIRRTFGFED